MQARQAHRLLPLVGAARAARRRRRRAAWRRLPAHGVRAQLLGLPGGSWPAGSSDPGRPARGEREYPALWHEGGERLVVQALGPAPLGVRPDLNYAQAWARLSSVCPSDRQNSGLSVCLSVCRYDQIRYEKIR